MRLASCFSLNMDPFTERRLVENHLSMPIFLRLSFRAEWFAELVKKHAQTLPMIRQKLAQWKNELSDGPLPNGSPSLHSATFWK